MSSVLWYRLLIIFILSFFLVTIFSLFRKKYYLDFANSCVTLEDTEGKKQGKMSKDKLPGVGDTVTFQLSEMTNETSLVNLKIFK